MKEISDILDIEKTISEYCSPQRDFLVRVNGYQYLMSQHEMNRLCERLKVQAPNVNDFYCEVYDNRPLWKKDMDMRMGRRADFSNRSIHAPSITADRVLALTEYKRRSGDERL